MAKKGKAQDAKVQRWADGIIPVSEATQELKCLFYGKNGRGKTRLAASFPKPLILDCNERGTRSVREYPGVDVGQCNSWSDLVYAYWYLRDGDHQYQTVVIDTLTQAQNLCMRHVLKEAEDRDPMREPNLPDKRAWGKLGELLRPKIFDFRNLPMNVVFICQDRTVETEDEDEVEISHVPNLSPSVRGAAMDAVEIIGYLYRKEVRGVKKVKKKGKPTRKETAEWAFMMLTGPHDLYETKDRTGSLPRVMRAPTYSKIIQLADKED